MASEIDSWQDPQKVTVVPVLPEDTTHLDLDQTNVTVLDGATLPRSITAITITLSRVETVRNLHLLPNLQMLDLTRSYWLQRLDTELPASLWSLTLNHCDRLKTLPKLAHTRLVHLNLYNCDWLESLPPLPDTLLSVTLYRCNTLPEPPFIPDSLVSLSLPDKFTPGGVAMGYMVPEQTAQFRETQRATLRKQRFELIHEELMQKAWHPRRVEAWLLQGEHVLDNIMGV